MCVDHLPGAQAVLHDLLRSSYSNKEPKGAIAKKIVEQGTRSIVWMTEVLLWSTYVIIYVVYIIL